MIGATFLLAAWTLLLNHFDTRDETTNGEYSNLIWSILFGCALATVSAINILQINLLPDLRINQWVLGIELIAAVVYLFYSLSKRSLISKLIKPFKDELQITKALITTGITILLVFTLLTSAPLNWDSNAYNVARVSTMLSDSSSILDQSTASGRQAIYSLGHDILLYPDISFGILRGLPMVSLLELFVLLGTLLSLSKKFGTIVSLSQAGPSSKGLKAIGLVATILLFNSHQQVMQALITKNDLAITLLFSITVSTGIAYLYNNSGYLNDKLTLSVMILLLSIAINMKSYGIILIIPTLLIAAVAIARQVFISHQEVKEKISINSRLLYKLLIVLTLSTLLSFSIQTSLVHHAWRDAPSNRVDSITSAWTNSQGTWKDRFENSWINASRILYQGVLFPYTTLKPYLPVGPELSSPISDSIVPTQLQGGRGTAGGAFSLLYGTNPDMAYPFVGFQIGLALGLIGWCLARPRKGLLGILFILISTGLTFLFFSTALLYQPWISRFMGPVYIPLIPVAAIGICLLSERLSPSKSIPKGFGKNLLSICAFLVGGLPLISSTSLTGYLSRRAGMPQRRSDFYNQYLWTQVGLTEQAASTLVEKLKSSNFKHRYLCSSDGPWTLTPMVLSQSNQSFNENNIKLLSTKKCQEILTELEQTSNKLTPGQSIQINGEEFISLP